MKRVESQGETSAGLPVDRAKLLTGANRAHAMQKPTILLANRDRKLPFDISGFRVVFYTNTIQGKGELVRELQKHLESIRHGDEGQRIAVRRGTLALEEESDVSVGLAFRRGALAPIGIMGNARDFGLLTWGSAPMPRVDSTGS